MKLSPIGIFRIIFRACKLVWGFAPGFAFLLLLINVITNLLPLVQAKITGSIVDSLVMTLSKGSSIPVLLILLYGAIWALLRLSDAFETYVVKRWYIEAEQGVDIALMRKRADIDIAHYENPEFQNLLTRAFDRGNYPVINLAEEQFNSVSLIIGIFVSAGLAIRYPIIFLVVLVSLIPTLIVQLKYGRLRWFIWSENSPRQKLYGSIRSHIYSRQGVIQTKLLQATDYLITRAKNIIDTFKNEQIVLDHTRLWYSIIASFISASGIGLAFYLIIKKVISGESGIGDIVFLTSVLGQFSGMSTSLLFAIARQYEQTLYVRDIFTILDTDRKIKEVSNPVHLKLKKSPRIEFRDVSFKYEGSSNWALRHINIVIEPGEKIALVGENGAGKTTLLKLLARIYDPTEGKILINGIPLSELSLKEWGSYLSILLQEYRIHDFTIAESIAIGRSESKISRKDVETSSQLADAHSFIKMLPDKYDSQIGVEFDKGIELSHGQRQRLALARTIYRKGHVVILDEPTASVDAIAEEKFFSHIEKAVSDRTLFLVSHRFNTVRGVDKIVVFRHGEIVEMGSHRELIKKEGYYSKMWHSQADSYFSQKQGE